MAILATPAILRKLPIITIQLLGTSIQDSKVAKNFGAMIGQLLILETHQLCLLQVHCHISCIEKLHHYATRKTDTSYAEHCQVISDANYRIVFVSVWCVWCYTSRPCIKSGQLLLACDRRLQLFVFRHFLWMRAEELREYHTVYALHSATTTGTP